MLTIGLLGSLILAVLLSILDVVRDAIRGAPYPVSALILDAESVTDLDTSGARAPADLIAELRGEGVHFTLARSSATFEAQLSTGHDDILPRENRYPPCGRPGPR